MALLQQTTDLKSLKYGDGNRPYVVKQLNTQDLPSSEITARKDDLTRITKLLQDKPGLKFIGNQSLLQQTYAQDKLKKELDKGNLEAIPNRIGDTVLKVGQILGSTLAQIPVNGTGTHFIHGFRTDTYLQDTSNRSNFAQFFGAGGVEGAPYARIGETVPTGNIDSNFPAGEVKGLKDPEQRYRSGSNYLGTRVNQAIYNASLGEEIILSNSGSDYEPQVDSQIVNRPSKFELKYETSSSRDRSKDGRLVDLTPRRGAPTIYGPIKDTTAVTGSLDSISNKNNGAYSPAVGKTTIGSGSIKIQDFRNPNSKNSSEGTYFFNYSTSGVNRETRIGLGNQGAELDIEKGTKFTNRNTAAVDLKNALDVQNQRVKQENQLDFINFNFEVMTPEFSRFLYFRAYLDSLDDNFNSDWQTVRYIGRGENLYTYNGFSRDTSLSFKCAASTEKEMKPLYKKMNYLASATAPTYNETSFMRGTLIRVTVGDYLHKVPAVLKSVKYTWQKDYPWEISMNDGNALKTQSLPHVLDCSISLTILHDRIPETGATPFIVNPNASEQGKQVYI